jgi:lipoprotein
MNTKMKLRSAIAILLSALLILSIAGCSKKVPKKEEKKPPKPKKVTEQQEKNRKAAYSAYKTVIEQNATAIKAYSWQTVPGKDTYNARGIDRPIALCDIDNDNVPELFFFTSQNQGIASLHIYTFNGKEAVELSYDGFNEGAYSGKLADQQAAAGTSYVVYKGKESNTLYIYDSNGDDYMQYNIHRYVMKNSKLELVESLSNRVGQDDSGNTSDIYKRNGKTVTNAQGGKSFTSSFAQLDKAIIFSANREENNVSIWKKFSFDGALCISYDQAIAKLSK